jgi:uncharacterized YigZ family protein
MHQYRTIKTNSEGLYKEKGSKFIAYAFVCSSEIEAKELLLNLKKVHNQARHFCYAYRFGFKGEVFRANDDGEPNNSAGTPILGQLQSFELTNVLLVVVRYFGGTKLGVGGLVNAYKSAAKDAIENSELITKQVMNYVKIEANYEEFPELMRFIKKNKITIISNIQGMTCLLELVFPTDFEESVMLYLKDFKLLDQKLV